MIYLTFIDPDTKKEVTTQVVRCLTIGRGQDADINIKGDAAISRLHSIVIPRQDGRLDVRDLSSSAGTYIFQRGSKIRLMQEIGIRGADKGRAILFDGESFFVGELEIKVHYEEVLGEPTIQQDYSVKEDDEEVTNPGGKL